MALIRALGLGSGESRTGKAVGLMEGGLCLATTGPPNLRSLPTQRRERDAGSASHPPAEPLRSEKSTCGDRVPATPQKRAGRKSLHFQKRGVKRSDNFTGGEGEAVPSATRPAWGPTAGGWPEGTHRPSLPAGRGQLGAGHPSLAVHRWGPRSRAGRTWGHTARRRGQPSAGGQGGAAG